MNVDLIVSTASLFHLLVNVVEVDLEFGAVEVEVLLEFFVAQLVAVFVLAVAVRELLDCVVRQVDVLVRHVLERELFARSPDVSVFVPVASDVAVDRRHERKSADVELAFVDQQRVFDVFLHDVASSFAAVQLDVVVDKMHDLLETVAHVDAVASVCVFSGLDDPNVFDDLGAVVLKLCVLSI